jgi:hypothetical protein
MGLLLCSILGAFVLGSGSVNNGISFVAENYYFELSYGDRYEFIVQNHIEGSTIGHPHYRSILRIEIPPEGYKLFKVPNLSSGKAKVTWNPARTRVLVAFGEHAVILTPQFHILNVYQNMSAARWATNERIVGTVEVGKPTKYATGEFSLNVETQKFRRLDKPHH